MKEMKIFITLRSDLCASSGKGWSATIDNDVCFDEYGLPYIPARRIKGCLKAAASLLEMPADAVNRLFGIGGAGADEAGGAGAGKFRLADARIEHDAEVRGDILRLGISPEAVTDLFCDVRSSTQIENDTAKDNTLRFVRVVCRLSPFSAANGDDDSEPAHEPLTFVCPVSFDPSVSEAEMDWFENCCKALRSIGYKRNRGFGAIRCTLDRTPAAADSTIEDIELPDSYDSSRTYVITYKVRLDADVAVSRGGTGDSEDYISGSAVLGMFAGKYVSLPAEEQPDFNDVFYSGKVKFGSLTVTDEYGEPAYPAPFYLAKYKDSDDIVNLLAGTKDPQGRIPKPFKNGYLSRYGKAKVRMKVTYHHAHDERILYTQRCIEAGPVFAGRIDASGDYAERIVEWLCSGAISLGRSRTAQYGACSLISLHCHAAEANEHFALRRGETCAVVLRSDLIPAFAGNSPCAEGIFRAIIGDDVPVTFEKAFLLTRTSEGYNAKWNLKRPHRPAIKAGSTFVFTPDADFTLPASIVFAGEKQNEGCGMCEILSDADREFAFEKFLSDTPEAPEAPEAPDASAEPEGTPSRVPTAMEAAYQRSVTQKQILSLAVAAAAGVYDSQLPNNSQIGRLSLMASNALAKRFTEEEQKAEHFRWNDFMNRVASIKSSGAKEKAEFLIRRLEETVGTAFDTSDTGKLRCAILFLHLLRYRAKTKAAEQNRNHQQTEKKEGEAP